MYTSAAHLGRGSGGGAACCCRRTERHRWRRPLVVSAAQPSSLAAIPTAVAASPRPHPGHACTAGRSAVASRRTVFSTGRAAAHAVATAAAAGAGAAAQPDESVYTTQEPPAAWLGAVQAARYVGTGRGLEATRTLAAGDLLFVSAPLALIEQSAGAGGAGVDNGAADAESSGGEEEGEEEEEEEGGGGGEYGAAYVPTDADVDALVGKLQARVQADAAAAAWLAALDDGSPERARELPDLRKLASDSATAAASDIAAAAALDAASDGADADALADAVDLNYLCVSEDAATAELRGGEGAAAAARDFVGVWPEAALMNHSCAPNAAAVAIDGRLLVRATRAVAKQAELTLPYLAGPQLFAPLRQRQEALRDARGFTCRCPRCRDEARQDPNLLQLVEDIADACGGLEADLSDAVISEDARTASAICDQLATFIEVVDAAFNKLGISQKSQIYVQASLFRMYELAALATAATDGEQPRLVELLAALAGEVAPGSEEHVYWARRYRSVIEETEGEDGRFDGALRQADQACYTAHIARYGPLSRQTYRRLMAAAGAAEAAGEEEEEDGWVDL